MREVGGTEPCRGSPQLDAVSESKRLHVAAAVQSIRRAGDESALSEIRNFLPKYRRYSIAVHLREVPSPIGLTVRGENAHTMQAVRTTAAACWPQSMRQSMVQPFRSGLRPRSSWRLLPCRGQQQAGGAPFAGDTGKPAAHVAQPLPFSYW